MTWPIPNCTPGRWPADLSPTRFAAHIHSGLAVGCRVALLGMPDDLGIRLNNGRAGAAAGPQAFRDAVARYGASQPVGWEYPKVFDAGDVTPAEGTGEEALNETHRRVTEAVRQILHLGLIPVGVGGGHDFTFPFVRGVIEHHRSLAATASASFEGVYFDAHLDVRETAGSGMPFRRLVEDCGVTALDLIGFSPFVNSREHEAWFKAHGGRLLPPDASFPPPQRPGALRFVSLDLDVIDSSSAAGVSADNPAGMSAVRIAELVLAAGRCSTVACFDIMELSPPHDHEHRTARLAAHMFLTFLRGLGNREKDGRST